MVRLLALSALLLSARAVAAQAPDPADIPALLDASAEAWNRADLPGHVAMYRDSASFMTGRGPIIGRETTAAALERAFFRDGRPLQHLRFEQVWVRPLGPGHALVTGRFILSGGEAEEQSGWFTTVWEWDGTAWTILHDHSS